MPDVIENPVVGIIAGAGAAAVGVMTGQPWLVGAGVSMGLGAASNLLAPTQKLPKAQSQTSPLQGRTLTIRQSDAPLRLVFGKSRVGGALDFAHVTGEQKEYLHLIYVLAGHHVRSIGAVYRDGVKIIEADGTVVDPDHADRFVIRKRLGDDDAEPLNHLISAAPEKWTADHKLNGLAYVYLQLKWGAKYFVNGMGNFSFDIDEGCDQIWDPRTGTTGYTNNPALCIAHYLTEPRYGIGASYTDLDEEDLIASANICDEPVPEDTSDHRYRCDGVVSLDQEPASILAQLAGSMAGTVIPVGPKWRILAGAWRQPTLTLNANHLRAGVSVTTRRPGRELFNQVRGEYIGEATQWQPADYKRVRYSGWVEEDNGIDKIADLDLPFTIEHSMARRIAKIALSQNRRQIRVNWPGNLAAYRLRPGDTVYVDLDRLGWTQKTFAVETSRLHTEAENGVPRLVVDLALVETDANVYEWQSSETEPPLAADETDLPRPGDVLSPSGCSLFSGPSTSFRRLDGTWFARLRVTWPLPDDVFVTDGGHYEVQYKKVGNVHWHLAGTLPGDATEHYILDVEDGAEYVARVRSVSVLGATGPWVQSAPHVVVGKSDATLDVDQFDVSRLADGTRRFSWAIAPRPPSDLAGYRIYYGEGLGLEFDALQLLHTGLLTSSPYETNELAAGNYTFAIVGVDRSENTSAHPLLISVTLGDPRMRNVILARDERARGWPGTKTDCYVRPDIRLEALSVGDWSTLPATWEALGTSWRRVQTNRTPIVYVTPQIDVGYPASFTPRVTLDAEDGGARTIEMRAAAVPLTTEPWQAMGSLQGMRYLQVRVTIGGTSPLINGMTTYLDAEMVEDLYEDVDLSAGTMPAGVSKVGTGHFKVATRGKISRISQVQVTIQAAINPFTWVLVSKTATLGGLPAAEIKIFNYLHDLSNATVDVLLRGVASS